VWDCGRCRLDGPKGLLPLCTVSMISSGLIGSDAVNRGVGVGVTLGWMAFPVPYCGLSFVMWALVWGRRHGSLLQCRACEVVVGGPVWGWVWVFNKVTLKVEMVLLLLTFSQYLLTSHWQNHGNIPISMSDGSQPSAIIQGK